METFNFVVSFLLIGIILCSVIAFVLFMAGKHISSMFVAGLDIGLLISTMVFCASYHDIPDPIEVYRGNVSLKITYQDSVATDTVVIYNKKTLK